MFKIVQMYFILFSTIFNLPSLYTIVLGSQEANNINGDVHRVKIPEFLNEHT